jgi:hypothetical protein
LDDREEPNGPSTAIARFTRTQERHGPERRAAQLHGYEHFGSTRPWLLVAGETSSSNTRRRPMYAGRPNRGPRRASAPSESSAPPRAGCSIEGEPSPVPRRADTRPATVLIRDEVGGILA